MTPFTPPDPCRGCRHLGPANEPSSADGRSLPTTWVCSAFPDGIPQPIVRGERYHLLQYPGDEGIRFEPW
jgi:hypothetical protein